MRCSLLTVPPLVRKQVILSKTVYPELSASCGIDGSLLVRGCQFTAMLIECLDRHRNELPISVYFQPEHTNGSWYERVFELRPQCELVLLIRAPRPAGSRNLGG